jgi:hypothetical protein
MNRLGILLLLLAGCETTPPPAPKIIKIDSEPQGARVFIGMGPNEKDASKSRNYLGITPLEWVVPEEMMHERKYFKPPGNVFVYSDFVPPVTVFYAEPASTQTNVFSKTQLFHSGTHFKNPDQIPIGIFFDLTKP